jgi:hypothetical protein
MNKAWGQHLKWSRPQWSRLDDTSEQQAQQRPRWLGDRLRVAAYRGRGGPLEWDELVCSCGSGPVSRSGTIGALLHLAANLSAYPETSSAASQTATLRGFPSSELDVPRSHVSVGTDPLPPEPRRVVKCPCACGRPRLLCLALCAWSCSLSRSVFRCRREPEARISFLFHDAGEKRRRKKCATAVA